MKLETEIRNLKRELKESRASKIAAVAQCDVYRRRASMAAREAVDWERRFDVALSKIPPAQSE